MLEENREKATPDVPAPEEVVAWYIPAPPREVVDCYVQAHPLPGKVRTTPEIKEKRPRRGLWVFAACLAVLLVAAAAGWALQLRTEGRETPASGANEEGNASSIIHIFDWEKTAIPRYDASQEDVRLMISDSTGEELTAQDVYLAAYPSTTVVVATRGDDSFLGTGIIMTEDGYVITNAHVIAGGESCYVAPYGWPFFEAHLVGYDTESDIAVLKAMDAKNLIPARFGDSDLCRVGDTVYAIGNPLGVELQGTMTNGMLSAINRNIEVDGRTVTVLQTTAALNNGNSGGPLLNTAGEVIGVNTLKMSNDWDNKEEATVEGLGFALPISDVSYVVNEILATGHYNGKPTFGMTVITLAEQDGSCVQVYTVDPGGAAGKAGIREGDVILSVAGQEVSTTEELLRVRRDLPVGVPVSVELRRGGETFVVEVTLEAKR